jgi:DNA-binding MarR family transcriptional regulator
MVSTRGKQETAEVAVGLSVAMLHLRSRLREESGMTSSGFSLSQLGLLKHLTAVGPATAASLAVSQHVSPPAIAQGIATLKDAGMLATEPHPSDGRKVLISITPEGRRLFESLMESRETWLVRAIDAMMSPRDKATLGVAVELLERLAEADLSPEVDIR